MPNTIDWNDNEVQMLINERKRRNEEYWFMLGRSKLPFWEEVAKKIEEEFGTNVTSLQCQNKFNGIVKDCKVSKL